MGSDALISGCGIVSSSAQIAGDISGSFTGGFGYSGSLSSTSGNIITNGGFDADSDWIKKKRWTISAGSSYKCRLFIHNFKMFQKYKQVLNKHLE